MAKFKKVEAGDWQQPIVKGYKMACCDCGLVHTMDFRIYKGKIQFRAFRNERSTSQLRRHNGIKIKHVVMILIAVSLFSCNPQRPYQVEIVGDSMSNQVHMSDVGIMSGNGNHDIYKNYKLTAIIKDGSDTIILNEPLQVHYIKIGNDVYKLVEHNTTIERVYSFLNFDIDTTSIMNGKVINGKIRTDKIF